MVAAGFLLPNFLGFCVFTLLPVGLSLWMAFTNWSLKPSVPLEFLGLRNFIDLLGVRARSEGAPWVCTAYFGAVTLLLGGSVMALWSMILRWKGLRLAGVVFTGLGLFIIGLSVWRGAHHSLYILAAMTLLAGFVSIRAAPEEDGIFRPGRAVAASLAVVLAAGALYGLNDVMWTNYEPRDARFWQYLYNTFYLMLALPFTIAGSLGLAMLLDNDLPVQRRLRRAGILTCLIGAVISCSVLWALGWRDAGVLGAAMWLIAAAGIAFNVVAFRTIFYLPSFTSGVALMILWKALFNPRSGPINSLLGSLTGLPSSHLPQWLVSIALAKPALMIMGIWTGIGGMSMLLYLAALSDVPAELLEAADMDGASAWQRFVHIIWPQILPTTFFIGITSIIGGLQGGFEQARVMTSGGPAGATTTLSYYIYTLGFSDLNFGYAAALSWVLFAILFGLTALNWRFGKTFDV